VQFKERSERVNSLTTKQQELLDFISEYIEAIGYPPTIREMCDGIGTTLFDISCKLRRLERKGYIRRNYKQPRTITIHDPNGGAA
jgi:repressor LexA